VHSLDWGQQHTASVDKLTAKREIGQGDTWTCIDVTKRAARNLLASGLVKLVRPVIISMLGGHCADVFLFPCSLNGELRGPVPKKPKTIDTLTGS
jgi:hypothetical protein